MNLFEKTPTKLKNLLSFRDCLFHYLKFIFKMISITYASRGFGFVLFANQAGVINALSQVDHRMFGKLIDPKLAMPQAGLSDIFYTKFINLKKK